MRYFILLGLILFLTRTSAMAAEPVEISADETLEWRQNDKQYIANGNVVVTQGDITLYADRITAAYDDTKKTDRPTNLTVITARGNVRIKNASSTITAVQGTYDIRTGQVILTGGTLTLTTDKETLTARDRMTYNSQTGVASAEGAAKLIQGTNTLESETLTAYFKKDEQGSQRLDHATANGGLTLTTPEERLTGQQGTYNAVTRYAEVTGDVKIYKGPNTLEGARAEVNLSTNTSKIFGGTGSASGGRVKGVFFPEN